MELKPDETIQDLQGFTFKELLAELKESKTVVFLAEHRGKDAVILMQRKDWAIDGVKALLDNGHEAVLKLDEHNAE